jgi:hypothetical protein
MPAIAARTFGLELEVAANTVTVTRVLQAAGINVVFEGYTHAATSHWKVVTDGSVLGGAEVVSPILRGEAGIAEARRVCEALTAASIKVDRRCGYHVHVGADDLTADAIRNLVKRYAAYEASIDAWMPASRRNNPYCKSVANHAAVVDSIAGDAPREIARRLRDRYMKLNLQSLWRQGTVEFRQHSGTVDADKVENWLRFCIAFVEASASTASVSPSTYEPQADYRRQAKRNWGNIIEQVEAAGGSMELTAPRARTYRITGPSGSVAVTTAQMLALYATPSSPDLHPVAFAAWWASTVAPVLARPAAEGNDAQPEADSLFRGVPEAVATFYKRRAMALTGAAV